MRIEQAYQRYFGIVRARAQRILRDVEESSDVAQETFVKFWQAGGASLPAASATAWLYRVGTRLAIDRLRRRNVRALAGREEEPVAGPAEAAFLGREALESLSAALPRDAMEALILGRVDGLTQQEIAEVLQVSERTVRRLITRAEELLEKSR